MYGSKNRAQAGAVQEPEQEKDGKRTPSMCGTPDAEADEENEREDENER